MIDLTKDNGNEPNTPEPPPVPPPMPVYYGAPNGAGGQGTAFNPYPMPTVVKPHEKTKFTVTELVYSFVIFALSFLLLRFAVCNPTGFVTSAVFVLLITAALFFMKRSGIKGSPRTALTAGIMYFFSLLYPLTDNEFIKALDTVFLILCGIWLMYQYGSEKRRLPRFLPIVMIQAALEYPFEHFTKLPEAVGQSTKRTRFGKNIGFIAVGLLVTIIPTLVIGNLLMEADSGVEAMLNGLSDLLMTESLTRIFLQLAFSLPISFYLFGLFFANAHRDRTRDMTEESCAARLRTAQKVQTMIICTALTPICLLYLLFFISQANYLMSAFMNRLPEGFSHAEYARRGFFELLAIVIINIFIILISNLIAKRGENAEKSPAVLRAYTVTICFFTLVMIASALSKMVMYISVYGLTELRLYTGWFMVLCAFLFAFIIVAQFRQGFAVVRPFAAVFVVMFALLTFGRPDYVIARYNTELYLSGSLERYDIAYLYSLSDDAKMYCLQNGQIYEHFSENRHKESILENSDISSIYVSNWSK